MPPALIAGAGPAIAAAGAAAASAAATAATVAAITSALIQLAISAAVSFALNAVSGILFGKPTQPGATSLADAITARSQTVRSAAAFRQTVYGEVPVSGPLAFMKRDDDKSFLHMVVLLASHEVEAIGDIFINDQRVVERHIGADGRTTAGWFYNPGLTFEGKEASLVRIRRHLGTDDGSPGGFQNADPDLVADVEDWTEAHQLNGIAYVYVRVQWEAKRFARGVPNIKALVKGKQVLDPRDGVTRYTANPALIARDYLTSEAGLGAGASEIDDDTVIAAANICDERVSMRPMSVSPGGDVIATFSVHTSDAPTDPPLVVSSGLDDNRFVFGEEEKYFRFHTGDRVTVWNSNSPDDLPAGLVNGQYYVIRLDQGVLEHDAASTTGGDESTSALNGIFKLATSYQNALEGIAVDITDEGTGVHSIRLDDQVRYDAHGAVTTEQSPIDAIEGMATAMAGAVIWQTGKYKIYAAAAEPATVTLTAADLRGPIQMRAKPERRDLFNRVSIQFVDQDQFYQATDAPPVENALYEAQDGGEQLNRDIELQFTTEATRAQRIGKIHLEKSRQGITVEMPCKWNVLQLGVWDTVNVTLDDFG